MIGRPPWVVPWDQYGTGVPMSSGDPSIPPEPGSGLASQRQRGGVGGWISRHRGGIATGLAGVANYDPNSGFFGNFARGLGTALAERKALTIAKQQEEKDALRNSQEQRGYDLRNRELDLRQGELDARISQQEDWTVPAGPDPEGNPTRALPPWLQGLSPAEVPLAGREHAQSLFRPQAAEEPSMNLSPEALAMTAQMYAKTGTLPPGFGKAAVSQRSAILNKAAAGYPGLDVATNKADYQKNLSSLKTLQTNYDQTSAFGATAEANAKVLDGTLDSIPNFGLRYGNRVGRWMASQAGSPEVSQFHTALETVRPEFGRILQFAGTGGNIQLTDSQKRDMKAMLGEDFTANQLRASLAILRMDYQNKLRSYGTQIDTVRNRLSSRDFGTGNPNSGQGAGAQDDPLGILGGP